MNIDVEWHIYTTTFYSAGTHVTARVCSAATQEGRPLRQLMRPAATHTTSSASLNEKPHHLKPHSVDNHTTSSFTRSTTTPPEAFTVMPE